MGQSIVTTVSSSAPPGRSSSTVSVHTRTEESLRERRGRAHGGWDEADLVRRDDDDRPLVPVFESKVNARAERDVISAAGSSTSAPSMRSRRRPVEASLANATTSYLSLAPSRGRRDSLLDGGLGRQRGLLRIGVRVRLEGLQAGADEPDRRDDDHDCRATELPFEM